MRIEQIRLDHFRSYEYLDIDLDPGTNLFYGDNAQGKTNILEAVYMCGTTRSHRTSRDKEVISFDQDEGHICMKFKKNENSYKVDMHLKKNRAKGIAVNGRVIRRAGELIGLGCFVFFSPEDLNLIKSGPAERRRFMNMELCQISRLYVHALEGYQKALAQRNQLLKDYDRYGDASSMLDVWDDQLVSYGMRIIEERTKFVERLNEIIKPIHEKLSGNTEELEVVYQQNTTPEDFWQALKNGRARDRKMKSTGTGPHKDDLVLISSGMDIRHFGSQGQQRTCALSLKLSEIELMKQEMGETPVLLMDDVLSELDSNRQHFLLESISGVQTLITCTGVDDFVANRFQIDKLFHVTKGMAKEM